MIPIKASIEVKESSPALQKLADTLGDLVGTLTIPLRQFLSGHAHASEIKEKASAEAMAMVVKAKANSEVIDIETRAEMRVSNREIRTQRNIENLLSDTIAILPENVSDKHVEEDWAPFFLECAQDVSDETVRRLWSRILAGEVAEPNSYSRRTLHILRLMNREEVDAFGNLCNYFWSQEKDQPPVLLGSEAIEATTGETVSGYLWHFGHIGLVSETGATGTKRLVEVGYTYHDEVFHFDRKEKSGRLVIDRIIASRSLSMSGWELYRIANPTKVEGFALNVAKELAETLDVSYKIGLRVIS